MSIASQITAYSDGLADAYDAVAGRGGTIPQRRNLVNLPTAINTIPSGGSFVGVPMEVSSTGIFQYPTVTSPEVFTFTLPSDARDVGAYALDSAFKNRGYSYGYMKFDGSSVTQLTKNYSMQQMFMQASSLIEFDMSNLATISGASACYSVCWQTSNLTTVKLGSLTTIDGSMAFYSGFSGCSNLTSLDLGSLTTITSNGSNCFYQAFSSTGLTSLDLSSLTTVAGKSAFERAFTNCAALTSVDFSNLTSVTGETPFLIAFSGTALTSVTFPRLSDISGNSCLRQMFANCQNLTDVYFPALTTSSFGSRTNQFNYMLQSDSNVTVHFPAAIQSTIGNWSDVTNGFQGTNTTVLFDL